MVYIYKITSPTGSVYIGITRNIRRRWMDYRGLRCHKQAGLYNSLLTLGPLNHAYDIIHELPPDVYRNIVVRYEKFYIKQYKDCGIKMLNMNDGGSTISKESRLKLSKKMRGNVNGKNRIMTPGLKEKIRNSLRGGKRSEECRLKMRNARLGKDSPNKGRKYNGQQLENILRARSMSIGLKRSDETKRRMSEARKKAISNSMIKSGSAKLSIEQVIDIFKNKSDRHYVLAKKYNVDRKTISAIRKGKNWKHVTQNTQY
jgi:group I intron endonuclease